MLKIIKQWVGWYTEPDTIYQDSYGFYVQVESMPVLSYDGFFNKIKNPYNYQKIKQDCMGVWRLQPEWLGLNEPLSETTYYE